MPLLRDGLLEATRSSTCAASCRAASRDAHRRGATLAELEVRSAGARRAARGVPARREPAAAQHGLARRQPAAGDALLVLAPQLPVPPPRRRQCHAQRGRAPRACDLRERVLRVGAPFRRRRRAARTRRDAPHRAGASCRSRSCTGCRPTTTGARRRSRRASCSSRSSVPDGDASVYLKAMDRKRWAFPLVGVAAARTAAATRIALAGVAPIPWLLERRGARRGDAAAAATPTRSRSPSALVKRAEAARSSERVDVAWHALRLSSRSPRARRAAAAASRRTAAPATTTRRRLHDRRRSRAGQRAAEKPTKALDPRRPTRSTLHTNCGNFAIRLDVKRRACDDGVVRQRSAEQGYFDQRSSTASSRASSSRAGTRPRAGPAAPATRPSTSRRRRRNTHRRGRDGEDAGRAARGRAAASSSSSRRTTPAAAGLRGRSARSRGLDVVDAIGKLGDPSTEQATEDGRDREGDRLRSSDDRRRRARGRRGDPVRRRRSSASSCRASSTRCADAAVTRSSWSKGANEVRTDSTRAWRRPLRRLGRAGPAPGSAAGSLRSASEVDARARRPRRRPRARPARGRARGRAPRATAPVLAATYDGARSHPVLLARCGLGPTFPTEGGGRPSRARRLLRPATPRRCRFPPIEKGGRPHPAERGRPHARARP